MKKQDVFLTDRAVQQLNDAADWYAKQNPQVADEWFNGIIDAIDDIGSDPQRFAPARENDSVPFELRERRYGLGKRATHRILFAIRPDKIVVHHVRHVAQHDSTDQ